MPTSQLNKLTERLRRAVLQRDGAGLTDGQLLGGFVERQDEAALEALVRRHGPMVLGVCRRVTGNHHDAEDAFQATFLVLVRKAGSIDPREMVGNWLYGVAYNTALKARAVNTKRRAREKPVTELPEPEAARNDLWNDLRPLLDQELSRLPDKYRVPVVLCDLEGKTRQEAARQLGWPEGTLSSRLARARTALAKRLTRRGLVLSAGLVAAVVSQGTASACAPTALAFSTVNAAKLLAAGPAAAAAGVVSAEVAALTEGMMTAMLLSKPRIATAVLLAVGIVCTGSAVLAYGHLAAEQKPAPKEARQSAAKDRDTGDKPKAEAGGQPKGPAEAAAKGDQGADKPGNPRVSTDRKRATIEGQIEESSEVVLRVGEEKDKMTWTHWTGKAGAFKAVVELSDKIKLNGGKFGSGFVFSVDVGTSGSRANVPLLKAGPMPSGRLSFREDGKIVRKDGVTTFADIRNEDGKSVPVSILIRKSNR